MDELSGRSGPLLGVVGIGRMGSRVLFRLSSHFDVAAYDVAPVRVTGASVRWCGELEELASLVDVLITVLPGPAETDTVMRTALPLMRAGSMWLDLGSGDPAVTTALADLAATRQVAAVAAPMGGGPSEVAGGTLFLFAAGDADALDRAQPILQLLATEDGVRVCGRQPADGQVMKLLANALWFANAVAAAEALLTAKAFGIDAALALDILGGSAGGSVALTRHLPQVLTGNYLPDFGIDRVVDELNTVHTLARMQQIPTVLLDASLETHVAALARFGPQAGELLAVRLMEEHAGHQIR